MVSILYSLQETVDVMQVVYNVSPSKGTVSVNLSDLHVKSAKPDYQRYI